MDLGVLVCQMQQADTYAWSTLHFICERRAVQLVKESRDGAAEALALPQWQAEAPGVERSANGGMGGGDEPPPLDPPASESSRPDNPDDEPPPLT